MAHRLSAGPGVLLPFADERRPSPERPEGLRWYAPAALPFTFSDYRALVAWTEGLSKTRTRKPTPALLRRHDIERRAWAAVMRRGTLSRSRQAYPGLCAGRRTILDVGRRLKFLEGRITAQACGDRRARNRVENSSEPPAGA